MGTGWRELSRDDLRRLFMTPPIPNVDYRFFTFDRGTPMPAHWDIVGLWERQHDPLLLDVFLIHQEHTRIIRLTTLYASQWLPGDPTSDPPRNLALEEPGTLGFIPAELLRLIELLERFLDPVSMEVEAGQMGSHFRQVHQPERPWPADPETLFCDEPCYRYYPDADIPTAERQVAVISLAPWEPRGDSTPVSYLCFLAFERSRYADPHFDPSIEHGLGYLTLNAGALRDLIDLLKQHAAQVT